MAGGEGLRLRPLTETCPKPLLPVGGRPLLDTLIYCLGRSGFTRIYLVVRYLRERIEERYAAGHAFGVNDIRYLREPAPYGTAGGLTLIPKDERPTEPFLVVNADILTPLDFGAVMRYHVGQMHVLTLVRRRYTATIPHGWPVVRWGHVIRFEEKPARRYLVNSGIYCLNSGVLDTIPAGPCDMPDVIRSLCRGGRVGAYRLNAPFHEIGSVESYRAAEKFYEEHMR